MITKEGIQKALEFAQGTISNTRNVPSERITNYILIFKDKGFSDDQFFEAVKDITATQSAFLPKPKEIFEVLMKRYPRSQIPRFNSDEVSRRNPMPRGLRVQIESSWAKAKNNSEVYEMGAVSK